ncbi:lysozyme inhibitor LprI family protein [uncultured Sphingomonas sp.]|uniref:lysozyme inhibitor LprI family protein n=1 Tax=uncultured Sphingomonas sp. TaxID=158754 RepID=UPI00344B0800
MIVSANPDPAPCPGATTPEVNACLAARFSEADADLNRYYEVAVQRARKEGVAKGFIQAQRSWLSFRNSECSAIFEKFGDGTIRTSMEIGCRIRLTRLRTYMI